MPSTQQDIAEKLKVSVTTVSLALRDHPRIPEETRRRVAEVARELGYKMNPMVAALMSQIRGGRTAAVGTVIGLLVPRGGRRFLENSPHAYTRRMLGGLRRRAEELGYQLDWFESEQDDGRAEAAARVAAYRGVRGLLIPPVEREGTVVTADWSPFSAVAIGQSHVMPGLHHIGHNLGEGIRYLMKICYERGYRRLGLRVQDKYDRRTGRVVTGGFFAGLAEAGVQQVAGRWVHKSEDVADGDWLEWLRQERIDAVITQVPDDLGRVREAHFTVPDTLGMAFLSLPERSGERTGLYQDPEALGHAAVDFLTSHMQRNDVGVPPFAKTMLTSPVWREGGTLRKANGESQGTRPARQARTEASQD